MQRRAFLCAAAGSIAPSWVSAADSSGAKTPGPSILTHEHILVDFVGAASVSRDRYDLQDAFRVAKPKLEALRALGCVRLLECTPNYIGRDPRLLRMLSDAVGIEIWTNTGLYAAADHKFLPDYARMESAQALAKRWIAEYENGIDGMKPRFIKIGVNKGPLHALDRKVVEAAVLTSRETGLSIAAHTGDGAAALEELRIVQQGKLPTERFVWVHAQSEMSAATHRKVAEAGAWVSFDGISKSSVEWHQRCVEGMSEAKLMDRVLISHDAGWYQPGEPGGGGYRGYTFLYSDFQPKVDGWFQKLLWENPRRAFGS